ncbi:prolyl 4- beta subunit precursor, putative [Ichthyophthirius multifiliis]|uniref:Protein disulfide-isomerase n=1 Tax=Ichthyophthirius multifiliis TaxID=5932 RepID=G0QWF9_ICHMU|nr:prolyl 4- beta subunit precursor, putative [Ichthyophthirius multifiliis]EGR30442.1 prolyl 4- beta subunit precursor, putative [Ichthyophthirius multifiliis]|eukprot:XP_004032029.1 prolyl 4- beta subunit precursor, putative [Ichthyophthirius multifiliis]
MNKLIIFTFFLICVFSNQPEQDEGVYVLTDSNFNEFVLSKPFVLVEFYAPWCGHCKSLAPEYSKAALQLQKDNSNVFLAKVDATENKESAEKFGVSGYPTLKFFAGSLENPIDYSGGRNEKGIIGWLNKRTGSVSELIQDNEALKSYLQKNPVVLVYFGQSETDENWSVFKNLAMTYDDVAFAHVFIADIRAQQQAQNTVVVLYKHFDELRNDYEGITLNTEDLQNFIEINAYPTLLPFNDKAIQKVFQQANPTIFLFCNENEASQQAEQAFSLASKAFKGKLIFSISKVNDGFGHYQRLADYVGVNTANAPQVMLIHAEQGMLKYKFESNEITMETLSAFVEKYLAGKADRYLKSEDPPATNDEPVKVIVGKTFQELVLDSTQDVLVEFYAPWCGHCKELAPKYESAAKKLAHNKNLVIAKLDASANEISSVSIKGYPTIKFYPVGKKDEPIDYDGEREEKGIIEWLKKNVTHKWEEVKDEL